MHEGGFQTTKVSDAIVIGAGLTGLACAYELKKRGCSVHVLEASNAVGGVVGTFETGGFLFESGPNTVPASAANLRSIAAELGVARHLITSRPEAKKRYLFRDGGLHALPSGPLSLLKTPLLSARAKRRLMSEPVRSFKPGLWEGRDPTLEEFLIERIGREATRTLAGAFVRGVYAAEIEELGARDAFPRVFEMCRNHGGLVRGLMAKSRAARQAKASARDETPRGALLSFDGGFSVLTRAFESALAGDISRNTPVAEIDRGPGGWRAILETGEALSCRELVLATPAPVAQPLVSMCAPERLDLAPLNGIGHAAITAVHMGLEGVELPPGFGFLVPPDEERADDPRTPGVLGMLFISNLFDGRAPTGTASVTAMFRGGDVADLVGDMLVDRAVVALERALTGYDAVHPRSAHERSATRVVASRVRRWTNVIPRYAPGHAARVDKMIKSTARTLPGLHLAGSYVGGVSVDDRLGHGTRTAVNVHARLQHIVQATGRSARASAEGPRTEEAS